MAEFIESVLINGLVGSAVIFATYAACAYLLLNAPHGAISAWHAELKKLTVRLDGQCASLEATVLTIRAPLEKPQMTALSEFVWFHETVHRVGLRLEIIGRRVRFAILSVLCGFAIGIVISAPLLFNQTPFTSSIPWLAAVIAAATTSILYSCFHLRHVDWWNRLRNRVATDEPA